MTLFEAWGDWLGGQLKGDTLIWGVELIWWGRIGKLLQFMGGATIVAEIIGSHRLRGFGNSLHSWFNLNIAGRYIENSFRWYRVLLRSVKSGEDFLEHEDDTYFHIEMLNLITAAIGGVAIFWYFGLFGFQFLETGIFLLGILVGVLRITVVPFITIAVVVLVMGFGTVIDLFFIESMAWLLDRPQLDKWIKLVALLLLLIGFHFDFLTS